jgi:hypothetical protein
MHAPDIALGPEPIRVPAWSWLLVLTLLAVTYLVLIENGAMFANAARTLHEFFHDARHFVGVPCH